MNELIKVSANRTVDARELHGFLEVDVRFNDWIQRRIEDFEFKEGIDFHLLKKEYMNNIGKNVLSKDYVLSISMAKELCMVERNEKGRQARKYFIEVEERWARGETKLPTMTAMEMIAAIATQTGLNEQKLIAVEAKLDRQDRSIQNLEEAFIKTPVAAPTAREPSSLGIETIRVGYFLGCSVAVVKGFLEAIKHPRKFFMYFNEDLQREVRTWAYATEGLEEAGIRFFQEAKITRADRDGPYFYQPTANKHFRVAPALQETAKKIMIQTQSN